MVEYPAEKMYALVEDVERYPEFLPWCAAAHVEEQNAGGVHARVGIDFRGIRQHFVTHNTVRPPSLIEMKLVSGPFRHLEGCWRFKPLGNEACKVEFRLHYEFSSRLLEKLVGPVFHFIANSLVEAFIKRAQQLYTVP